MKKSMFLLILVIIFTSSVTFGEENFFTDIDENIYFESEILYLYEMGIVSGFPDNTFKPDRPITNAELIKILLDGMGYKQEINTEGYWGSNYIDVAEMIGFIEKGEYNLEILSNYTDSYTALELLETTLKFIGEESTEEEKFNYYLESQPEYLNIISRKKEKDFDIRKYVEMLTEKANIEDEEDYILMDIVYSYNEALMEDISPLYIKGIVSDMSINSTGFNEEAVVNNYITRAEISGIVARIFNKEFRINIIRNGGEVIEE